MIPDPQGRKVSCENRFRVVHILLSLKFDSKAYDLRFALLAVYLFLLIVPKFKRKIAIVCVLFIRVSVLSRSHCKVLQ